MDEKFILALQLWLAVWLILFSLFKLIGFEGNLTLLIFFNAAILIGCGMTLKKIFSLKEGWKECLNIIYFSLNSSGTTGEEWIQQLSSENEEIVDNMAKNLLRSSSFKATNGVTYTVAVLKGNLFKDCQRNTEYIRKYSKKLGLKAPPMEIGCLIMEKFSYKELGEMKLDSVVIMNEPVEYEGDPLILQVNFNLALQKDIVFHELFGEVALLDAFPGDKDVEWERSEGFAFLVSQTPRP